MAKARKKPPKYHRTKPAGSGGKVTYEPPKWRFDELVLGLGHEKAIVDKLVDRGYPRVPVSSVTGWRIRNSIPPAWLPVFIQLGLEAKLIRRIEDLRIDLNKE